MDLTTQQEALINYTLEGKKSFVGLARAGTGKTFTLKLAAEAYHKKFPDKIIQGMAFNRIISQALSEAIPFAPIKTANAWGHGGWIQRSGKNLKLEVKKTLNIIKSLNSNDDFSDLRRAISICKAWGLVPKNIPAEPITYLPDEIESYKFLFDNYNIDTADSEDPISLIREVLRQSIMLGWKGVIDFDDQLYLPVIYKASFPKADLLLVDEVQDLNPIQRYMAKLMLKPNGRLFALGDDCQAIYGFRGADRDSISKIIEEFDCEILKLTTSFRCPKEVVKAAQVFVPDIEPFESNPDGRVVELPAVAKLVDILNKNKDRKVAILCRNNAPLISAALNLIRNNIGAIILGRDLEKGLIRIIDQQRASSLTELNSKLWNYIAMQQDILIQKGAVQQAALLEDKGNCLEILILNEISSSDPTISGLKTRIKALFSDKVDSKPVLLSTIHKAKGMEWPVVFILDKSLMPSKFAKTPAEIQQENNLHYVAITRAQKTLVYIKSENI